MHWWYKNYGCLVAKFENDCINNKAVANYNFAQVSCFYHKVHDLYTSARLNGYNAKASETSYEQNWSEKYLLHPYIPRYNARPS